MNNMPTRLVPSPDALANGKLENLTIRFDNTGARLAVIEDGMTTVERHDPSGGLSADQRHAIQIQDDGRTIRIARDGQMELAAEMSEDDLALIRLGQAATERAAPNRD